MSHLEDAEEEAEGDMTPMIDAVFLLIIFFLCIDFKVLEAKVPAYLPTDKGSAPTESEPVEQLSVRVVCENFGTKKLRYPNREAPTKPGREASYILVDHRIFWTIDAKRVDTLEELEETLKKISSDESRKVPDKDNPGQRKLMPVVIEPQEGATYGDVATTIDYVRDAEFEEISFGGSREGFGEGR
ncbi:MAG: biopolymer transporter ExbD [Planctomycetota bacterium]